MAKCMSCEKTILLTKSFGNVILCKNCASIIDVSSWKSREFSSMTDLLNTKNVALQKASNGSISQNVISEIKSYFDEYVDAGFITSLDGKAGQTLKVFANHCIISTKSETKKTELENMFYQFDDDDYDDNELLTNADKKSLARGLMTGKIVQAGIGAAVSATLNKQEKEKNAEKKSLERHKNISRLITVGDRRVNFTNISCVETFSRANTANGYLKFVKKGAQQNTLYDCEYFFFNNSIPFKSKKIKESIENIKNVLIERIDTLEQEEKQTTRRTVIPKTQHKDNVDSFDEIRKFKQLLDEGIITEDEFNTKKKELLKL